MELATGGERTIDGIADGERVVLGHPKTREAMRAGLAMYFVTLDDAGLMEIADRIVAELGIEWFFNIQLVGRARDRGQPAHLDDRLPGGPEPPVPRRQARARGDLATTSWRAYACRDPAGPDGAPLLRPARMGVRAVSGTATSVQAPSRPLRVVHCPVNTAGVPWTNVQALRRRGVDASLVVFNRYALHPEADRSLELHGGLARRQLAQWQVARGAAAAHRPLPLHVRADARAAVAAVPDPAGVPEALGDALPRLRHPRQDARGARVREEGRRRDRRQLRRDPLGARGDGDPARASTWRASRPVPPSDGDGRSSCTPRRRAGARGRTTSSARARISTSTSASSRASTTTRRSSATATPTSSSTSSTPAGTASSRSSAWRSASPSSRSCTTRRRGARRRRTAFRCRSSTPRPRRCATRLAELVALGAAGREELGRRVARVRRAGARPRPGHRPAARALRHRPRAARERGARWPCLPAAADRPGRRAAAGDNELDSAVPADRALAATERDASQRPGSASQLRRLGRHSAIYGIGGLVSRVIAVLLLPLYTRYLTPADYGKIETLLALTTVMGLDPARRDHERVLPLLLRRRRTTPGALRVLRTSFWFTMGGGTLGLTLLLAFAEPDLVAPLRDAGAANLVRAAGVALWAHGQLRAADGAVPRRGALGRVRLREPRERPHHDRR